MSSVTGNTGNTGNKGNEDTTARKVAVITGSGTGVVPLPQFLVLVIRPGGT